MKFSLLFDGEKARIGPDESLDTAPAVDCLGPIVEKLRGAQERLSAVPVDDLIGLCDAAATAWSQPENPMSGFIRDHGLGFLLLWMRRRNLAAACERSLRGRVESLDGFVRLRETDSVLVRAQPRGLAVHWVAGNVPVLGMLSLMQSVVCKNANLLKVARVSPGLLPHLIQGLAEISFTPGSGPNRGKPLSGRVITDAISVVYADRADDEAARELSRVANVRVAWGGLEAIEAIINLPRRFGTEDIVFGPKLSFAIVGAERLKDAEAARRTAASIAADACAFDQQGCNSPHNVFVERGGAIPASEFAEILGNAMAAECRRSPLGEVDAATAMNVLGARTEYAMHGDAYHERGMNWSVLYRDEGVALADPHYLRTLFVRPVEDIFAVVALASHNSQTVGLAVDDRRHRLADALTARGVERCPNVGNMRIYDTPWDGLFPMDRLVRWVSTY